MCVCVAGATAMHGAAALAAPLEPVALPAPPGAEVEPNDTPANASPIHSGERIRANLPVGDVDYYSFTAQAGERVFANTVTAGSSGGSDTILVLTKAEDGVPPIAEDDNDGSQLAKASSIAGAVLADTGTYYLQVRNGGTGTIAPYDLYLQLRSGPAPSETEPNDLAEVATPLGDGVVSGEHAPQDQDWYSLHLQAGDVVFFSLDITGGDPSKAELGFGGAGDPDKSVPLAVPAPGDPPDALDPSEALTMTVSEPGTYYAWVGSSDGSSADPSWTYELSATVIAAAQPECRTYSAAGASPIKDGATILVPISVPDLLQIKRASVGIELQESIMADLDISLRTPGGADLPLIEDFGSTTPGGQELMEVVFDDFAAIPPSYKALRPLDLQPQGGPLLALLDGQETQGTWNLVVRDDQLNASSGTVKAVKLNICGPEVKPTPTTETTAGSTTTASTGTGTPAVKAETKPAAPAISGLGVGPSRFRAARAGPTVLASRPKLGGALVSYEDSAAAQTNFVLFALERGRRSGARCVPETARNGARRACTRLVKVTSFVRQDVAGHNQFGLSGRFGAQALAPGPYQLQATAYTAAGLISATATANFRILPPAQPSRPRRG